MFRILLTFALTFFTVIHAQAPFDEAQVFEWWDDGIITPEEAEEIFSRLEEENYDEACLLAEVYAQEPCPKPAQPKAKPSQNAQKLPTIVPHGYVSWKGWYNSDGHLKKHRKELQLQFYYFKLRLGSQELLSYHRDNFEAHFGQVSTTEFHSHIPLDTLWGATLLYPISKFRFGAFIDSSKTFNARVTFKPNRENELDATFWKFPNATALALQARMTLGQIYPRANLRMVPVRARPPTRQSPTAKQQELDFMEDHRIPPRRQHSARTQLEQRHRRKLALGITNRFRKMARSIEHSVFHQGTHLKSHCIRLHKKRLRERPFQSNIYLRS